MRRDGISLFSLESRIPLHQFDLIGISLPYETLYTNALNLLDLAGIPVRSRDRTSDHPLVIAGGHAMLNPEPMAPFLDAIVIGEGEEVIHEILDTLITSKKNRLDREETLIALSRITGVYIPSFYSPLNDDAGMYLGLNTTSTRDSPIASRKESSDVFQSQSRISLFHPLKLFTTGWRLRSCVAARAGAVFARRG